MTDPQLVEDLIARLERERLEADRLYNEALTRVDHAIQTVPSLPAPPAVFDDARLADLNAHWRVLPVQQPSFDGSLKGRLRRLVWRMIGPPLEEQQRFNAALVDHLNRNAASQQQTVRATRELLATVGRELEALVRFESLLIQSLQTITAYVDSKDRSLGGSELRQRLALTEQRLLAIKRMIDGWEASASTPSIAAVSSAVFAAAASGPEQSAAPFSSAIDSIAYVGFEDRFRGARDQVSRRVEDYVPILAAGADIVDIGCGRGELLALLAARGVRARGVDVNAAMVEVCRARGFDAEQDDAVAFLERQPDASVGGLIAVQVVEHFAPAYLTRFLETAFHKMRPGAPLILETINPSCWMAFFETYLRDPTHRQAVHSDTLKYLVEASGFSQADIQWRAPVSNDDRLATIEPDDALPDAPLLRALNDHAHKLNRRLFGFMDYAVIARR